MPVTGTVTVVQPTASALNVDVGNFPSTQNVDVLNFPASTVVTQPSGANLHVDVDNFPATQPVSGTVAVSNFPATQTVSGTVSVSGNVTVVQPAGTALHVDVDNFPATQPVSGTVAVSNFPATQPVSGTVSVSNFPATQPVSGTVTANAGTGTFAVSAASLPLPTGAATAANQTNGTQVTQVSNFPAVQSVQGSAVTTSGSISGNGNILQLPMGAVSSLGPFAGITLEISGTWTSFLVLQGSNGGSYYTIDLINLSNPNAGPQSLITANGLYYAPLGCVNLELISAFYTSGTINCYASLRAVPPGFAPPFGISGSPELTSSKTPLTYSAPTTASVTVASVQILAANANRKGLYLSNTSNQQISFGFGGAAAVYQNGITLFPGEKFWMDEFSFSTGAVFACTTGATTYIGVQEITT